MHSKCESVALTNRTPPQIVMQQKIAANRLSLQHAFSATTMRIILLNIGGKTRKSYIITRFVSYACPMDAEV